jgi:hypothetical protein
LANAACGCLISLAGRPSGFKIAPEVLDLFRTPIPRNRFGGQIGRNRFARSI